MALPKFRKSKAKSRSRKAHYYGSLELPNLSRCSNCGNYKESHRVCKKCGFYKDKIIMEVEYKSE